jgi:hypothetical protein
MLKTSFKEPFFRALLEMFWDNKSIRVKNWQFFFIKSSDADAIRMAMRSLTKEARSCCNDGTDGEHALDAKASAWYHPHNTEGRYNEGFERRHLISIPWCLCDRLIWIKKAEQPAQEDEA